MQVTGKGMQEYGCKLDFSTLAIPVPLVWVGGLLAGYPPLVFGNYIGV